MKKKVVIEYGSYLRLGVIFKNLFCLKTHMLNVKL